MNYPSKAIQATNEIWSNPRDLCYCDPAYKDSAHRHAKKVLTYFATVILGLEPGTFEVRSNKGGIAVGGEVTLHTDKFPGCELGIYVQICDSSVNSVMFRTCTGPKDYSGGKNCWTSVGDAFGSETAMKEFAGTIQQMVRTISFQVF